MNRPFFAILVTGAIVVACGLDAVQSQGPDDDPTVDPTGTDASTTDASTDPNPSRDASIPNDAAPTGPCTTTDTTCSGPLAKDGWTPVVMPTTPTSACPDAHDTIDLVTDPTAQPGACTCGDPVVVKEPACDKKSSYVGQVGDKSCNTQATALNVKNGDCTFLGNSSTSPSAYGKYDPIQPAKDDDGECQAATKKDGTKVGASPLRICRPAPGCAEDTCNRPSTDELRTCVAHEGDVACPAGFTNPMHAGTSVDLACSACGCTVKGKCKDATLEFFADAQCLQSIGKRKVNGNCEPIEGADQNARGAAAFKYTAQPDFDAKPGAPSVATPTLSPQGLQTICCR